MKNTTMCITRRPALEAAAALSKRYISDRFLPDKAIDVMDEAASKKKVGLFTMPDALKKAEDEVKKFSLRKEEALMEGNIRKAKLNNTKQQKAQAQAAELKEKWDKEKEVKNITVSENDVAAVCLCLDEDSGHKDRADGVTETAVSGDGA